VLHPQSVIARPLSIPALAWLGTVSYSVYVWQQFFIVDRSATITIAMMCLMPLFVLGSYYLIERPFTRLGHRLTSESAAKNSGTDAAVAIEPQIDRNNRPASNS
jgi:peptidoglycan/LPS O-acetylase OafA/YrhL